MLKIFLKKSKKLYSMKFSFSLPKKKNILLYDEIHSLILKETIKKNFNILKTRELEIYFWIFLKQIISFDFKFSTYCKNYIKFTKPKVVITFNERKPQFFDLKNSFRDINFISIQNGLHFPSYFKNYKFNKSSKCDYFFVFNKYFIQSFQRHIKSKYIVLGNFKNNLVKINKSKKSDNFLLISEWNRAEDQIKQMHLYNKLMPLVNLYFYNSNKKIHILLRRTDHGVKDEINYYKKFFQSNCVFHRVDYWKKRYKLLDKYQNIIFMRSTMGYESIARKKKVAIFSPKILDSKHWFGWPAPPQKRYNFFTVRKPSYDEIKRVLDNIKNCSQTNWEKKYYNSIKDQLYYDKDNKKLKKIVFNLLKNSN
jgi:surface carbohydrate biosynthesis protein